jgi:hopanoid biosynthesis associated RND transporter like protein HpnN
VALVISAIQRHAVWILLAALVVAAACLRYTVEHLRVDTDTANMIDEELPFRQDYDKYKEEFSFGVDNLLLVIDAHGPEAADQAAEALASALRDRADLFDEIFLPGSGEFFERQALLYLELTELERLADRLIEVQPLLGRLSREPSLDTFADTLTRALEDENAGGDAELATVLEELNRTLAAALERRAYAMSWQRLLQPVNGEFGSDRRYIFVKPRLDFTDLLAAEPAMRAIREAIAEQRLDASRGVRVRVTGEAALAYEELLSALRGAEIAAGLALIMITGILFVGLGSPWLLASSLLTLIVGLVATAGFATLAVGHLNLISIAFAVLYIGLGIDYAIHVCLRYRELLGRGLLKQQAISHAVADVRGSLIICTLTTATAFYAFLPTAFAGVSELGLISGTGMFINLVVNLTVLPALLSLAPEPRPWYPTPPHGWIADLVELPRRHWKPVCTVALTLGLAAALLLPQVRFDRNPLNLRDPDSESVSTVRELMAESETSPMSINLLLDDRRAQSGQLEELRALPAVSDVVTLQDFVPTVSDDKLFVIDDLALVLGSSLEMGKLQDITEPAATIAGLERLRTALTMRARQDSDQVAGAASELAGHIEATLDAIRKTEPAAQQSALIDLRDRLLSNLPRSLGQLRSALQPDAAEVSDLPPALREQWINARGVQRAAIYAEEDINNEDALRRFVETVHVVVPRATGEPVLALRAGDAVVTAFQQAFSWALLLITTLLLILLRSAVATAFVVAPLMLVAAFSLAVLVLLGQPLNFANVIALPLLFGIGVDNGIHMVQRARQTHHPEDNPLRTSTARAVLLSALTTGCSFGNLLLSPHPGTASMGLLLTVGVVMTLIATLVVLPALLVVKPLRASSAVP